MDWSQGTRYIEYLPDPPTAQDGPKTYCADIAAQLRLDAASGLIVVAAVYQLPENVVQVWQMADTLSQTLSMTRMDHDPAPSVNRAQGFDRYLLYTGEGWWLRATFVAVPGTDPTFFLQLDGTLRHKMDSRDNLMHFIPFVEQVQAVLQL